MTSSCLINELGLSEDSSEMNSPLLSTGTSLCSASKPLDETNAFHGCSCLQRKFHFEYDLEITQLPVKATLLGSFGNAT